MQLKDGKIVDRGKREEGKEFKGAGFRIALIALIFLLVILRVFNIIVYPNIEIIPSNLFFAVAIVQVFFLWLYESKEKKHILWVQKKKEELNEIKSKFTVITSHELTTPITVIKEYMGLLLEEVLGKLNDEQKNAFEIMKKYFGRLEEIQGNLSRLYSGSQEGIEKNMKLDSVQELIKVTAGDMMPFIKKRNQVLALEIEENIAPVMMDVRLIRQVLVNFLLNSIRFTPDSGKIIIRAKDIKTDIRVEVEDNGIGIPKDKLSVIFESFYEAGNSLEHSSGTIEFKSGGIGLGLTIAKNIIDIHNGKIWAESEVGKFTKQIFTLPK
ncbi:MAG: HAMP domain-containing sensor histidine kinase [Candidatus Omnitrophota bacterium]